MAKKKAAKTRKMFGGVAQVTASGKFVSWVRKPPKVKKATS